MDITTGRIGAIGAGQITFIGEFALPVEQVKTVCVECRHYVQLSFTGRNCEKAKAVAINPVTGSCTWESNYTKNRGNCSDWEPRPPAEQQPAPAPPPAHSGSSFMKWALAKIGVAA